jgi:hypothetical protein
LPLSWRLPKIDRYEEKRGREREGEGEGESGRNGET